MQEVKLGGIYQHKEEGLFQIITVAEHKVTKEKLVICQRLSETFDFVAVPVLNFLEAWTEREVCAHLPVSEGEYFAVTPVVNQVAETDHKRRDDIVEDELNPDLAAFLDANTPEKKLEALQVMQKNMNEYFLSSVEVSLDLPVGSGSMEERIDLVKYHLKTHARFESGRLR